VLCDHTQKKKEPVGKQLYKNIMENTDETDIKIKIHIKNVYAKANISTNTK